ncbi:hypothetical protein [Pseudomonas entomophila]|uniref:hypothetical protein n=1 Tax=Pseudomonas entomophila TaxID=312306 RepID=UPI003EBAB07B
MLIVDPLTGALYTLPEHASVDMGRPLASAGRRTTLKIAVIDDLSMVQREQLVPIR